MKPLCPRCNESHNGFFPYGWSGRGRPRMFCASCRHILAWSGDGWPDEDLYVVSNDATKVNTDIVETKQGVIRYNHLMRKY